MPNPEEYRRTRRIVDLLLRIANQPRRWTRRDLAAHYEVSEQQLDKDLLLIRHGLVMPLRHCPQGYYFERMAGLPALTLSLPEALTLLLAARLGQQMPGVSRADLAAAIARLETLLPTELLPLVGGLARGRDDSGPRDATLRELQLAIAERSRLRILYRSASHADASDLPATHSPSDGGSEPSTQSTAFSTQPTAHSTQHISVSAQRSDRLVDPYTLLPYLRSWYLVGHCHLRGEVRMFKVDRIRGLARTGEHFPLPEQFDLAGYLGQTWGLLRGEAGEPEEVVLEFSAAAGRWVRDEEWHPSQRVEDLPDGRVRLVFYVGITPELRRWVLGFGRQARVVRPASLAAWVREEVRVMLMVLELGEQDSRRSDFGDQSIVRSRQCAPQLASQGDKGGIVDGDAGVVGQG